ncbi:MAG: hypothetical protein KAG66_08145, partial [Methylococcales bacterium]|nr:hypothetical protein [Methylococcales bacterium]
MLDMTGSLPPGSWPNTGSASISPTTGASFNLRDRLKERELFGDKTMLVFHAKIPSVVAEDTIVMLISKSDDAYVWVKASNQNLYLHAGGVDYIVPGGVFGSSWRKFYLYSSRATNGTWYSKFRISSSFASMPVAHFHMDTITCGKEAFEWDIAKPGAIDLQICSVVICPSVKHSMDLRSSTGLPGNWSNLHEPSGYPLYSGTKTLWKFNGPLTDTTSNKHYYSLDSTAIRMFSGANVELTGPPFLPWTDRALKFDTADSTNTSHGYEGPGYTSAENASDFTWEITIRIDQNISSGYASILTI